MVSIYNKILIYSNSLQWFLTFLLIFFAYLGVNTFYVFILLILCQLPPLILYSWMRSKTELLFDISLLDSEISQEVYFFDSYEEIEIEISFNLCGFFKLFQIYDLFEVPLSKNQDEEKTTTIPSTRMRYLRRAGHRTNLSFKNIDIGHICYM